MSLEDEVSDVVAKAIRGLGKNIAEVSNAVGVTEMDLRKVLDGEFDEPDVRRIAMALDLDEAALVGLRDYLPKVREIEGIRRIELPFRQWTVNAWHLRKGCVNLLFDAGWNRNDVLSEIDPNSLNAVFITHGHEDHVGGLEILENMGLRIISETEALDAGEFEFEGIGIKAVDLAGHCKPSTGYFVSGFERQLLVAGDAVFAGSIGGCANRGNFQLAVGNLRKAFAEADDGCLLLPGHGPLSSITEEISANPFSRYFS